MGPLDLIRLQRIKREGVPQILTNIASNPTTPATAQPSIAFVKTNDSAQELLAHASLFALKQKAASGCPLSASTIAALGVDDGSILGNLPSGWFQSLLSTVVADLPQILSFIQALSKMFGGA
jgi:hypothetical protein